MMGPDQKPMGIECPDDRQMPDRGPVRTCPTCRLRHLFVWSGLPRSIIDALQVLGRHREQANAVSGVTYFVRYSPDMGPGVDRYPVDVYTP